jgi:signal transduction histidine kinase
VRRRYKRAQARQVRIWLEMGDGRLRGAVEDGGKGFDLEAVQRSSADGRGLGLLGGSLHIETAPGQGTRVFMDLPTGLLSGERAEETVADG